jgi:hypothetical protein
VENPLKKKSCVGQNYSMLHEMPGSAGRTIVASTLHADDGTRVLFVLEKVNLCRFITGK